MSFNINEGNIYPLPVLTGLDSEEQLALKRENDKRCQQLDMWSIPHTHTAAFVEPV